MSVKQLLKDARIALDKKEYGRAKRLADEVIDQDTNNYHAYVFAGLCSVKQNNMPEAEEAYQKAIQLNPDDPLALRGLVDLYKQHGPSSKAIDSYLGYSRALMKRDQREMCAKIMHELVQLITTHGSESDQVRVWEACLQGEEVADYLEGLLFPTILVLRRLIPLVEKLEKKEINTLIGSRKTRLRANMKNIPAEVKWEVYSASSLEKYYRMILDVSEDDQERRETEDKLANRIYDKLCVAPTSDKPPIFQQFTEFSLGLVAIKSPSKIAWDFVIDSSNHYRLKDYDISVLRDFIELFPSAGLTDVLNAFFDSEISPFTKEQIEGGDANKDDEGEEVVVHNLSVSEISEIMAGGYDRDSKSVLSNQILTEFYLFLGEYESASEIARAGLNVLASNSKKLSLKVDESYDAFSVCLGTAYVYYQAPKNYDIAYRLFNKVLAHKKKDSRATIGKALIFRQQKKYSKALGLLEDVLSWDSVNVHALSEAAWCKHLLKQYKQADSMLSKGLQLLSDREDPNTMSKKSLLWWRIGTNYAKWDYKQFASKAYNSFVQSLKYDINNATAYTSIGTFYADIVNDQDRANKCFHRAFDLDGNEIESARRLAIGFANNREWDLVRLICDRVLEADKQRGGSSVTRLPSWPYRALGIVGLQNHEYTKAIQNFQSALKGEITDINSWIGLGEAYMSTGRYIAALKTFERAMGLDPENWLGRYQMGTVQMLLGQYEEACETFRQVLKSHPDELGVEISLAETLMFQSRYSQSQGFYDRCIDEAEEALHVCHSILSKNKEIIKIWKVAADACEKYFELQAELKRFPLALVKQLLEIVSSNEIMVTGLNDTVSIDKVHDLSDEVSIANVMYAYLCLSKTSTAYCLKGKHSHGVGNYNLGRSFLIAYLHDGKRTNTNHLKSSIYYLKKATNLELRNADFWSTLGVAVSFVNVRAAQHSFIRSLIIEFRQPQVWSNLASLYLRAKDFELAKIVYTRAQSIDPEFAKAWEGRGLISMWTGDKTGATEILEHAASICSGKDGLARLLYGLSALDAERSGINNLSSPVYRPRELGVLIVKKLSVIDPDNVDALELQSLFLERLGDQSDGIDVLERAKEKLEANYEVSESQEDLKRYLSVTAQLARFHLALKHYDEAIDASSTVIDLSDGFTREDDDQREEGVEDSEFDYSTPLDKSVIVIRLSAHITAGLANFFTNRMEEAIALFSTALIESENNQDVVVLLAQVLWATGGESEHEVARDELFSSVERGIHLMTILLLGTIGVLDSNDEVIDAVQEEIDGLDADVRLGMDYDQQVDTILCAFKACKSQDPKPTWLRAAFLRPWMPKAWSQIDSKTSLVVSQQRPNLDAIQLSNKYAQSGESYSSSQRAVILAPWNFSAWKSLSACIN